MRLLNVTGTSNWYLAQRVANDHDLSSQGFKDCDYIMQFECNHANARIKQLSGRMYGVINVKFRSKSHYNLVGKEDGPVETF